MNTEQTNAITKLEAIAKLPEKWRNDMEYPTFGPIFAQFLEQALGSLPVEPVPDVPADKWAKEKAAHAQGRRIQHRFLRKWKWSDWFGCDTPEWLTRDDDEYRIASDPAPAGKLTDKELGSIGAKAAFETGEKHGNRSAWLITVHDGKPGSDIGYSAWRNDEPARTAFARAVREAVVKEQADRFAAINAVANDRMEEIARLTAEVKAKHKLLADANRGAERNAQINWSQAGKINSMTAELAAANAELERLRWRPVSVKPTREDADEDGFVITFRPKGTQKLFWRSIGSGSETHWRPFCPPPAPTTEEKERAEMEADYQKSLKQTWMDVSQALSREAFEWGWKMARAAKEADA